MPAGTAPFRLFDVPALRLSLRRRLSLLGVAHWDEYGLHSFRRGHAMDLAEWGGDLAEIIRAGGWKSSAFRFYLESHSLGKRAVAKAQSEMVDHSSASEAEEGE